MALSAGSLGSLEAEPPADDSLNIALAKSSRPQTDRHSRSAACALNENGPVQLTAVTGSLTGGSTRGHEDGTALDTALLQLLQGVRGVGEIEAFHVHVDVAFLGEGDHLL